MLVFTLSGAEPSIFDWSRIYLTELQFPLKQIYTLCSQKYVLNSGMEFGTLLNSYLNMLQHLLKFMRQSVGTIFLCCNTAL